MCSAMLQRVSCVVLGLSLAVAATASSINPFDFNVFSLGSIGTSVAPYRSDFQGIAGVYGKAYFSGFSLHDVAEAGPQTPYSLYAGDDVRITGAINNGGVEVAGNLYMNGASINGPVSGGGELYGTGGSVAGPVTLGGTTHTGWAVTFAGPVVTNARFTPTVDLSDLSSFFMATNTWASAQPDSTLAVSEWGQLKVALTSGINTVTLTSAQLNNAWGIAVTGPSDATLIINVPDQHVAFDSLTWNYTGGVDSSRALMNLVQADDLALSGGNHLVNILAPRTDVNFNYGVLTGNLIVGSLAGGGQVNAGRFGGEVPEPGTLALLLVVAAGMACRRASAR
jgi:choice-of-anchor A domain-containing protein